MCDEDYEVWHWEAIGQDLFRLALGDSSYDIWVGPSGSGGYTAELSSRYCPEEAETIVTNAPTPETAIAMMELYIQSLDF